MTKLIDPAFAILDTVDVIDALAVGGDALHKDLTKALDTRAVVTAKIFDHAPVTGVVHHHPTEPDLLTVTDVGPIPWKHTFHADDLEELTFE